MRASAWGRGNQCISAWGGDACRAGKGYLLCPAGGGCRTRLGRGALVCPTRGRGALCTVGGKVSVYRAGRGRGICCARQGVWARCTRRGRGAPVCPTGGRGTLCTEGERYLLRPEGRGSHRVRTKGERNPLYTRWREWAPVTFGGERRAPAASDGGERRLRGRRGRSGLAGCRGTGGPSHWAERGAVATGRGGAAAPGKGRRRKRGEIANKKRVILCIL